MGAQSSCAVDSCSPYESGRLGYRECNHVANVNPFMCRDKCTNDNDCASARTKFIRNFGQSLDDGFEAPIPIPRFRVDFNHIGAVPVGWRVCDEPAPEGFLFAGGCACIIEEKLRPELNRRVLLSLPDSAVDVRRARLLTRVGGRQEGRILCRVWRANYSSMNDQVILEFDFPVGEPLDKFLERQGNLTEDLAKHLCRDLLDLITAWESNLTLGGMMDASLVYLTKSGLLSTLLPLICLLSPRGLKATAMSVVEQISSNGAKDSMSPELKEATLGHGIPIGDKERCITSDSYAVMALVLEALAGIEPKTLREDDAEPQTGSRDSNGGTLGMSKSAKDLFNKALYEDPAWRLCGQDALGHPWLRKPAQRFFKV
mmetsp:Transcript_6795/g.12934  ORF Transcript_6795/g.12934 Transcript_6795/m.12934 type:complete len:372 (+) Transcript_6795:62-1177(+)